MLMHVYIHVLMFPGVVRRKRSSDQIISHLKALPGLYMAGAAEKLSAYRNGGGKQARVCQ